MEKNKLDMNRYIPELALLQDAALREKCADVWREVLDAAGWTAKGPEKAPMGCTFYTDENLFSHTREVVKGCDAMYKSMSGLFERTGSCDYDTLIASALLHDVGKLIEFQIDDNGKPYVSEDGYLFRHPVAGAFYVEKHGLGKKIVHTVLTHSAFSSPEGPKAKDTPESMILKAVDELCFKYVAHHFRHQKVV